MARNSVLVVADEYGIVVLVGFIDHPLPHECVQHLAVNAALLQEVGMPDEYVYPIHGDCRSPAQEAKRYSDLVSSTVPLRRGFPTFDIVLLGAGDDGHTSSIFPGQEYLLSSFHPYEKSINPYNGQPRIAMTGCLLFSARKLIFLITGKNKTEVVYDILKSGDTGPAAYVAHHAADVDIFTDIEIDG